MVELGSRSGIGLGVTLAPNGKDLITQCAQCRRTTGATWRRVNNVEGWHIPANWYLLEVATEDIPTLKPFCSHDCYATFRAPRTKE